MFFFGTYSPWIHGIRQEDVAIKFEAGEVWLCIRPVAVVKKKKTTGRPLKISMEHS